MAASKHKRELCRLGVNVFLTHFLLGGIYTVSITSYLPSYHRFVTNPRKEDLNATMNKVEPGLGETELFYSFVVACLYFGSVVGGFVSAFLVKCVPYWYLFIIFISSHILGWLLYANALYGWILMVGLFLVGLFLGAEATLVFQYAGDLSHEFVELLKQKGEKFECDEAKAVKIRNYLYAMHGIAYSIGAFLGTGVAVVFVHLPIEQYRSIAWFNMALGIFTLGAFIVLFRSEGSWKKLGSCQCVCQYSCEKKSEYKIGPLKVFIIISLLALSFFEVQKWAFVDVLLNPVLSDSFGLSLGTSSYFYLGLSVPRMLGSLLLVLLQRLKLTSQIIACIGIVLSIFAYLLIAGWQAIPYDPCTEFSPFHHPERFGNKSHNETHRLLSGSQLVPPALLALDMYSSIEVIFDDGEVSKVQLPAHLHYDCYSDPSCPVCNGKAKTSERKSSPCLSLKVNSNGGIDVGTHSVIDFPQLFSCSSSGASVCVSLYHDQKRSARQVETYLQSTVAEIQSLMVLPDDVYANASNACMNASNGECHWIPYSTITGKKCLDCPPICRSKKQTLLFPLFVIGMVLQLVTYSLIWIPTVALANNQAPKDFMALMNGGINGVNAVGLSIGPLIVDALYEVAQKRTFFPSILMACLHIPFLIELIVLYRHLGPRLNSNEQQPVHKYECLKDDVE